MKYIILFILVLFKLQAAVVQLPISSIDEKTKTLTIKIDRIDVGMSGFVVHHITPQHSYVVNNVVVESFDANKSKATLKMTPFHMLDNDSVPSATYKAQVGDTVELAFGYNRALLIAPSEMIYHRITKSVQTQWIHPDLFATILSYTGHPSPLKSDFDKMSDATSTGLLFIYLDKKIYTIDMKSFKILSISKAPLEQKSVKLPFYTRVQKIESSWWDWGAGTEDVKHYTPYYYKLLMKYNKENKELLAAYKQFENGETK
jgi:hypothetical protein